MYYWSEQLIILASLRERKGREDEAIVRAHILLNLAIFNQKWRIVSQLYWELALIWQHTLIYERNKDGDNYDQSLAEISYKQMRYFAQLGYHVVVKYKLNDLLVRAYKFLAKVSESGGNYHQAKKYYQNAQRTCGSQLAECVLEINGHLAYVLLKLGYINQGARLGIDTYKNFTSTQVGLDLKKNDYYTWLVWRSGVVARICSVFLQLKLGNKQAIRQWLLITRNELLSSKAKLQFTIGDFSLRLNQLASLIADIKKPH